MISNVPFVQGNTPLHEAVERGHRDTVQYLLRNGADPDSTNYFGETPLFLAIDKSYFSIASLLLDYGASINFYDKVRKLSFAKATSVLAMIEPRKIR